MLQFLPICGGSAWRKLAVTAAVAIAAWNVQAQVPFDSKRMDHESGVAKMAIPSTTPAIKSASVIKDVQMTTNARLLNAADLQAKKPSVATDVRKAAQRAEGATDFSGNWIVSYNTLLEGGDDGGEAVTLEASTKENVYVMKNLWVNGTVVNIQIDPATGAVTIANQVIATLQDGTKLDITAINHSTGNAERKTPITGQVNADGTITIGTWWAVYKSTETEMSKGLYVAFYNTRMIRPNGQMTFVQNGKTNTVPVYGNQVADNVLEITNMLNGGLTIEMTLNRNLTAEIALQPILCTNGTTYQIVTAQIDSTNQVHFYTPIITEVATNKKEIKFSEWSGYGLASSGSPSWLGMFNSTTITLDNEVSYPTLNVSSLQGEGTKEKPWLITSKEDLTYLSESINSVKIPYGDSLFCTGEYFRLANDIDMSGHRYTAIANDYYHIFNGTFDGNGHTITGLTMNSSSYSGVIGHAGPQSLITNLNIVGANIKASKYAGCVVGWSTGEVSNINVKSSTVSNSSNGVGAIGNIVAVIKNCHADSCNITGMSGYVAGLIGQLNVSMANCSATNMRITAASPKTGPAPVGGLVGLADYPSTMTDSYFSGTIDAYSNYSACVTGGLIGTARGTTIERCFSVGTVRGYSSDAYTGGLVGEAFSVNMTDCYANGRVDGSSSKKSGGLIGWTGYGTLEDEILPTVIKNCYSSAALTAETYLYVPGTERRELLGTIADGTILTVKNSYFNKQLVNFGSTEYGVMTSDLVSANGPAGFSADKWVFTEGYYPRLKGLDQTQAALYSASALIMGATNNLNKVSQDAAFHAMGNTDFGYLKNGQIVKTGYYSNIEGDSLILNKTFAVGTDTLFVVNGRAQYHYFVKVAPVPFTGEGTEGNPYLISSKEDLIQLSTITTDYKQTFPATYFKMTNDIDLEYSENFKGISCDGNTMNFAGVFDGNGYTVHRMKINQVKWTKEPTDSTLGTIDTKFPKMYQGFVGRLAAEGIVRNLTLAADCQIVLGGYSGAIVGYNFGLIENCRNLADVTTYAGIYVGGITGYNNNIESAHVVNCYNAGNITSARYGVGGITGVNYNLVKECVNTGNITATVLCTNYDKTKNYLVGGITSSMSGRLEDCVNYGTVSGNDRIGGLSGSLDKVNISSEYKNDVVNCLNLGMVYANDWAKAGAMGGVSGTNGTISGDYWDGQILPIAAAANTGIKGMAGTTTAILTSGTALEGFNTEVWDFTAGVYPTLKSRAKEDAVKTARSMVATITADKNAYNMCGAKATLATAEGLTWKLASGKQFNIDGTTLTAPASVEELVIDTLYAVTDKMVKPILLKALPAIPLSGAGTEADPYLIKTAADWNALATFMTQTANGLDGEFVSLSADIDFAETTFIPLAADGVTYLNGTLDGKGHTVSGIKFTPTATFAGAIGVVSSTGVVKNLTLAGNVTSAQASTGGFTGKLYGTLEKCVNAINITSTKATVGGFAATMYDNATVVDCTNKGNLKGASSVGGIAGSFDSASKATVTRCGNEGTITGNSSSSYVGGIVGTAMPSTITDCWNSGTVTVTTTTSQAYAAGIIGYASGYVNSTPYVITGCKNSGAITAKSGVAGIVANAHATVGYATLNISDCQNSGKITAKGTSNMSNTANAGIITMIPAGSVIRNCHNTGDIEVGVNAYSAGIVGYARPAATSAKPVKITGCTNTGNVQSKYYYAAGIMGNVGSYVYVDSCSNTGNVAIAGTATQAYAAGGIAGALTNANAAITNSWNIGNISATNRAGGIVGMNAQKAKITNCWNGGNISSTSTTQGTTTSSGYGIGGVAGQGSSIITNCYNYGTLTGVSRVGGIVGATSKNNTQLINCYNAGRIEAPVDTCGNLVGVKVEGNGSMWNTSNAITNCYYVTEFGTFANTGSLGKAVTIGELSKTNLGTDWTIPADYSLPVLSVFADSQAAQLYSAAVILAADNTFDSVTTGFNLGTPAGVQWTSSVAALTIDGNTAKFTTPYAGEITLTATLGSLSRTVTLKANVITTGIDSITTDDDTEAEYFNLQGVRIANPVPGQIYIVRRGNKATKELYR